MSSRNKTGFTEKELLFIQHFAGDQTAAARAAGYKSAKVAGSRLMAKPHIQAEINKKISQATNESAKQLAKRVTVTRSEIINGLHKEAKEAESDSARVSAWSKLSDIFKLSKQPSTKSDDEMFEGWTDEECQNYIEFGILPSWYGLSTEEDDNANSGQGSAPDTSAGGSGQVCQPGEVQAGAGKTNLRPRKPTGRPN